MRVRFKVLYRGMEPGDEAELSDYEAATLITHGVAEEASRPQPKKRQAVQKQTTRTAEEPNPEKE